MAAGARAAEIYASGRTRTTSPTATKGETEMRKFLEIGGLVAAVVLIAFGIGAIAMSINGHNTVNSSLKAEQISGTPDMTPAAIKDEAMKAGLNVSAISFPTK